MTGLFQHIWHAVGAGPLRIALLIVSASGVLLLQADAVVWASVDPTLVGHWTFDENSGTTAFDASSFGNDGTLVNGPAWVAGHVGTAALQFDGVDDRVEVPDSASLDIGPSDFTVMAWVYRGAVVDNQHGILGKITFGCTTGYYFGIDNSTDKLTFEIARAPGGCQNTVGGLSVGTVPFGSWHHVAVVFQRTANATFYIDGVASGSVPISGYGGDLSNTRPLWIGRTENVPHRLAGAIDDIRIYTRALSVDEISELYPGAQWGFDENGGSTAFDSSANGNDGTLINGPTWIPGHVGPAALLFDGFDDYVEAPDSPSLDIGTSDFTVMAWVNRGVVADNQHGVVGKIMFDCTPGYYVGIDNLTNQLTFEISQVPGGCSNTFGGVSAGTVPTGSWHHVAVVFKRAANATFYIDGAASGSVSISAFAGDLTNARPLRIGLTETFPHRFVGAIDDVRIYRRALSGVEIARMNDEDLDGCSAGQEMGGDPVAGGARDPNDHYDFYDVAPANPPIGVGRDRFVDLGDTLLILQHFGHGPGDDSLDNELDRYTPNLAEPWRSAESNDGVDLQDALANLRQFGHDCSA